jgi:hypothetical protein
MGIISNIADAASYSAGKRTTSTRVGWFENLRHKQTDALDGYHRRFILDCVLFQFSKRNSGANTPALEIYSYINVIRKMPHHLPDLGTSMVGI